MSATLASDTGVLLNMQELALALKTSRQSLSLWVKKWPDFPVTQRGTNGTQFLFDVAAVVDFLRSKKEEQARSRADRDEKLAQLVLPLALQPADEPALSIKDQIEAVRLRRLQREEMERAGQLVEASEVSRALSEALVQWNGVLHSALRAACRDHNLPESVVRSLDSRLADAQRQFTREIADIMQPARESAVA